MPAQVLYQEYIVNYRNQVNSVNAGVLPLMTFLNPPVGAGLAPKRYVNPAVGARTVWVQREFDAAMWYGAMTAAPSGPSVARIFQLLFNAGVMYKSGLNWMCWGSHSNHPVASLLSHGGRILIQTRGFPGAGAVADPVWTWLNGPGDIQPRTAATHGLETRRPAALMRGHMLHWTEKGGGISGMIQSAKGAILGRHHSFNVALGGVGNYNPVSRATTIQPNGNPIFDVTPIAQDGLNGHMYVYYRPPTANHLYGGILIGCENAEHGAGTNPHTACGHGLGGAQPVSASGGAKWGQWAGAQRPTSTYTSLVCDLVPLSMTQGVLNTWLTLPANAFDPDDLDQPPRAVPNVGAGQPT